eukprot:CAMPEP_0184659198 /NCGR_PEP_ID=MMETSP0308-20130426/28714_1 /TAXON_ID=38269 /ORGANISM="Gloeochaete witrockiana, Strain SAG 46.84" /LENGTH=752 /DNA_ID=CAMNT_0027098847 /DNA_START=254 /DNA_END=2512 /DNA_ORIENTATION=+
MKEFVDLVKHVQSAEKKVHKKVKKTPNFFQEFLNRKIKGKSNEETYRPSSRNGSVRASHSVCYSTNINTMKVDRSGSTPIFTSFKQPAPSESSSDDTDSHDSADSGDTDDEDEKVEAGNIVKRFLESLTNQLRGREGRERYMNWLFRLADTHRSQHITMDELDLFLQAVSRDGINLEEMVYEQGEPDKVAQRIMDEYNIQHTGLLSKEEFMVLADLIAKEYELCQARDMDCIGKYQLCRTLGKGSYGVVRSAINKETGERKAIKIIKRGSVSDMSRLDVEIKAMMMLRHPNVVRLEEVLETEDNVCLVMELCGGGSLYEQSMLTPEHPFDEDLARFYFMQLVDGLAYCHASGVVHRDLRLENLLLDNQGHLKITDFGHAGIFKQGWDIFSTSLVGSLYHLSPEQICGKCYSGEKMDIWSAGVLLYCLLHGQPPFFTENVVELLECIKAGRYEQVQTVSAEARDLIDRMLQVDPAKRISCPDIKRHPWMQGPIKEPVLVRYEIPLDPTWLQNFEIPKHVLREAVEEKDIHVHPSHQTLRSLWVMHCYLPAENLKFSVAFIAPEPMDPTPYLEFKLKEGESLLFRKLCRRFQALCQRKLQEMAERLKKEALQVPRSPSAPVLNKPKADTSQPAMGLRNASMTDFAEQKQGGERTQMPVAREILMPREVPVRYVPDPPQSALKIPAVYPITPQPPIASNVPKPTPTPVPTPPQLATSEKSSAQPQTPTATTTLSRSHSSSMSAFCQPTSTSTSDL